ncbi:Sporulation domain-containing protein [Legionella beliardensis]|uniref:Sporulation domain-containing protein n=1 Tax=Legionella beliardensis TaxID=91822 RepID=A0A378HZC0_9GAMM|nr:SPOR domain-containing protein [Legionella beliardensis]STX28093.1 Sporulation domain-containing protein [Legionella beliardensis]
MAKDYVRKRHVRQRSNVPKQLVMLLTSFLCGYLTATVFDFTSLTTWVNKNVLNSDKPSEVKKVVKHQSVKPKFEFYTLLAKDNSPPMPSNRVMANSKSSRQTVSSPLSSTNLATQGAAVQGATTAQPTLPQPAFNQRGASSLAQATTQQSRQLLNSVDNKPIMPTNRHAKEAFLIQIAAFNKRQDAEHLKASLVLRGFDVAISPFLKENINWYRVVVGPFPSRAEAEKAQLAVARSERMKGMIRKIDV